MNKVISLSVLFPRSHLSRINRSPHTQNACTHTQRHTRAHTRARALTPSRIHPPTHTHTHTVHTYWLATPYWLVEDAEGRLDAIEAAVLFARYAARLRTREWRRTVSVPTPRHDSNESETLQLEPNQLDGKHVSDRNRKPLAADIRILPACRGGQQATESAATTCFKLPWSSHHDWRPMTRHKSLALD
jgi:hypothetical protein